MFIEIQRRKEKLGHCGNLLIVCGLSGAGKTTMIREALTKIDEIQYLKTYTTRKPRSEEEASNSIEYIFVSPKQYKILRSQSQNWDHSDIYGQSYGADIDDANTLMKTGKNLIVATQPDIDIINDLKSKYGLNSKLVFIDAPTIITNERLLTERNVDEHSRISHDSSLNVNTIRQISNSVFVPSMNLEEDAIQFCRIIELLVNEK